MVTEPPEPSLAAMALNAFGHDPQMRLAIEHMAELIAGICLVQRSEHHAPDELAEDIADVEIMLEQLRLIVHRHTGTDATMDEARRRQRAKALADTQAQRRRGGV